MDEGGKRLAAIPVGSTSLFPPSALCADRRRPNHACGRPQTFGSSEPTNRPTNQPPLGAPNDPNLTLARSLPRPADKLLHFFHSFSPLKLEDGCPRRGHAAPGSSSMDLQKKTNEE